ncbi:MAG: hybrid sensor histidine kinase/response regulator [Spirobacillus cienkowskii]|jgi:signal transduction histidine kinase|uniref:histidine kinase n=1 Tax=Spirobacillus cienkowskii TaxID=495820 RepID=A0A369KTC9_9BACT|nr:MAG: hybrid sensor histidine kinase/response regulator [Spirobacillus cienkowskii]
MPSVLIVDDEPMICKLLSLRYEREGYKTLTAHNGQDALAICKKNAPDVIITDINLPVVNGIKFIEELKDIENYKPVIFSISGSIETLDNLDVNEQFSKPVKINDILDATKKYLFEKDNNIKNLNIPENFELSKEQLELISELTPGIIHNINNHISFISSSSYLMKKNIENEISNQPNNEKLLNDHKIFEKIYTHSLMIAKIIKSIKMLAYPVNKQADMEKKIISIINSSLDLMQDIIKINEIKVYTTCNENVELRCYPEQIIQIFINLIKNACDAVAKNDAKHKWLKIDVKKSDNLIRISFTDAGKGISKEIIPHLMKPFYTNKKRNNGLGLGLSICKKFMEIHNGEIEYDDESDNTKFILKFNAIKN